MGLLVAGVGGAVARPRGLPAWAAPLGCAVAAVAVGAVEAEQLGDALHPLVEPIAFLLAAVPLAVLLDRLGLFAVLASRLARSRWGVGGLWVLAAAVTTVLNLDAAVVLLTPLYVGVARRTGRDPLVLAAQPVLLACLASSALPVSNLTNLIAASWTGAGTAAFLTHLGPPSLVATGVGWWRYRRVLAPERVLAVAGAGVRGRPGEERPEGEEPAGLTAGERRALAVGLPTLVFVLVGFVGGPAVGVPAWAVALVADVVLVAVTRHVPATALPWGTAVVAGALGVLATGAVAHLPVDAVVGGGGTGALAGTILATGVAANLVNNLPSLLVALPAVGTQPTDALWAVLVGVNMGPVVLATGSLASLLWLDVLARLGVPADARDYARIGLRVGLPAAAAGAVTFLAADALGIAGFLRV